jgi:hypothetical protein
MINWYKKKPVAIQAMRLTEDNLDAAADWIGEEVAIVGCLPKQIVVVKNGKIEIETLEGVMTAGPGDWLIRGVKNEFYPCKNEVFEATYEFCPVSGFASARPQNG